MNNYFYIHTEEQTEPYDVYATSSILKLGTYQGTNGRQVTRIQINDGKNYYDVVGSISEVVGKLRSDKDIVFLEKYY